MKILKSSEFKTHVSSVLDDIREGHPTAVSSSKPTQSRRNTSGRKLGVIEHRGTYKTSNDFSVADEEFLNS